jgi:orotate phosphoribosyltransferase
MQCSKDQIETLFEEHGVILKGHFLLASGLHSDLYFEKFRILENPTLTETIVDSAIDSIRELDPELVVGPTTGGVVVAYQVAKALGTKAFYAERGEEGGRVLRRGFRFEPGTRVLIVDDVMTTGGSVKETIKAVEDLAGQVVGVFVLVKRSKGIDLPVPLLSAYSTEVQANHPQECPMCKSGTPLTKPGGGR